MRTFATPCILVVRESGRREQKDSGVSHCASSKIPWCVLNTGKRTWKPKCSKTVHLRMIHFWFVSPVRVSSTSRAPKARIRKCKLAFLSSSIIKTARERENVHESQNPAKHRFKNGTLSAGIPTKIDSSLYRRCWGCKQKKFGRVIVEHRRT